MTVAQKLHIPDLRKLVRGRDCLIRLPMCNGNRETVVGAHYRLAGTCGMGLKPPDILIAPGCFDCHSEADRRTRVIAHDISRHAHAEGVLRYLAQLWSEGYRLVKIQ